MRRKWRLGRDGSVWSVGEQLDGMSCGREAGLGAKEKGCEIEGGRDGGEGMRSSEGDGDRFGEAGSCGPLRRAM